jgi:hypothetical protein
MAGLLASRAAGSSTSPLPLTGSVDLDFADPGFVRGYDPVSAYQRSRAAARRFPSGSYLERGGAVSPSIFARNPANQQRVVQLIAARAEPGAAGDSTWLQTRSSIGREGYG